MLWDNSDKLRQGVQEVGGKWVNVEVAHAGMTIELSKYPWG